MRAALLFAAIPLAPLLGGCGGGSEGIIPPEPAYGGVEVAYPVDLWDREIEGQTNVRILVNEEGTVDSVEIVWPSGYSAFDTAAVRGARNARFRPAKRGQEAVTVWTTLPVVFSKKPG